MRTRRRQSASRSGDFTDRRTRSTRRPTFHDGTILFGSAGGRVYCLRASDGVLACGNSWRRRPTCELPPSIRSNRSGPSTAACWSTTDVAYFTAGRSTYLDGGIRVYASGAGHRQGSCTQGLLEGPHPLDRRRARLMPSISSGRIPTCSSAKGGFIYMRQKKMTPDLKEVHVDVLSSKGEQDVGLHVFSTAGLLDDSWYNRTFWMYSKRWPGFQLANQAPEDRPDPGGRRRTRPTPCGCSIAATSTARCSSRARRATCCSPI